MRDLYVKEADGTFVPIQLEVTSGRELDDKLIVVTVGTDEEPASNEQLEEINESFSRSAVIRNMMRKNTSSLLVLPHTIKVELMSQHEVRNKAICVRLDETMDIPPEFIEEFTAHFGKKPVILPAPISLEEYEEIKRVRERIQIRKERRGGGLNIINR